MFKKFLSLVMVGCVAFSCFSMEKSENPNQQSTSSSSQSNSNQENFKGNLGIIRGIVPVIALINQENKPIDEKLIDEIIASFSPKIQKELNEIITVLQNPNANSQVKTKKILLVGPSGIGKSMLARGIAQRIKRPYKFISVPSLFTKYQYSGGESIKNELKPLIESNQACVIILDEFNYFWDEYDNEHRADKKSSSTVWGLLDECLNNPNILIIGTANDIDTMPKQFETRFNGSIFSLSKPSGNVKKNIFLFYLNKVQHTCSEKFIERMASKLSKLSAREIEAFVNIALRKAYVKNSQSPIITEAELNDAFALMRIPGMFDALYKTILKDKGKTYDRTFMTVAGLAGLGIGCATLYYTDAGQKLQKIALLLQSKGVQVQADSFWGNILNWPMGIYRWFNPLENQIPSIENLSELTKPALPEEILTTVANNAPTVISNAQDTATSIVEYLPSSTEVEYMSHLTIGIAIGYYLGKIIICSFVPPAIPVMVVTP